MPLPGRPKLMVDTYTTEVIQLAHGTYPHGSVPVLSSEPAAPLKVMAGISRPTRLVLTSRDIDLLTFLGRFKYATCYQLAARLGMSEVAVRKRLPRLVTAGYLTRQPVIHGSAGVYVPTRTAMQVTGLDLPGCRCSPGTAAHTLGLVDLAVAFELAGETVLSEREIRAEDSRRGRFPDQPLRWSIDLGGPRAHSPDLVLVRPDQPDGRTACVAVELELNRKRVADWQLVLRAYRDSPHIGSVIYYAADARVAFPLAAVIDGLGIQGRIKVKRWTPSRSVPTVLTRVQP